MSKPINEQFNSISPENINIILDRLKLILAAFLFNVKPRWVGFQSGIQIILCHYQTLALERQKISYTAPMNNNKPKGIEP